MKLDKGFFLKVYGHAMTNPGFADLVIQKLQDAGCSRAEEYYKMTVEEYESQWREEIRPVSKKWRKIWQEEYEKKVKEYERKEGEELRKDLQKMSNQELMQLLLKNSAKEGL